LLTFPNLRYLLLDGANINNITLFALSNMPHLERLELIACPNITMVGLRRWFLEKNKPSSKISVIRCKGVRGGVGGDGVSIVIADCL
jgi:hypothetical protein